MNESTKTAIEKFLLNESVFKRIFNNDILISNEDIEEYKNIFLLIENQYNIESRDLLIKAQLGIHLEKIFLYIAKFIPVSIDSFEDRKLFFDIYLVVKNHYAKAE
jgi:hypothetical protein